MPTHRKNPKQKISDSDRKIAKTLRHEENVLASELLSQDQIVAHALMAQNHEVAMKLLDRSEQDAFSLLERNRKTAAALLLGKAETSARHGSRSKTARKLMTEQQEAIGSLRTQQQRAKKLLAGHQQKAIDTLRKRQQEAARLLSQQQLQAAETLKQIQIIVESSRDAIIGTTLDGIITSWNGGAENMFGYASKEVVGKKGSMLFPKEIWNKVPALLKKVSAKEVIADYDIMGMRRDGTRFDIAISISPIISAEGTVIGASVVERDITERKKYERRITESDVLKNKFIQIVAHQFRTPLSIIRWNLEALMGENLGALKPEQKEFIRITHDANVELIDRVGDLLTAMDIEEGRIRIDKSNISLESLLASVVGVYKPRCDVHKIILEYRPSKTSLPAVQADPEKIRAVFEKLVLNAINYTPAKGKIVASLSKKGNMVRFELKDTGIGIPKAEQSRVYNRFYRASNASAMMPDASGIGLYLAKYFVEEHGGKIGFTSQEGKGSLFWFELPATQE